MNCEKCYYYRECIEHVFCEDYISEDSKVEDNRIDFIGEWNEYLGFHSEDKWYLDEQ